MSVARATAHCPRCQELQDEVDYLKGEINDVRNRENYDTETGKLRQALKLTAKEAATLHMMYAANGRPISRHRLDNATLHDGDEREYAPGSQVTSIYICRLRKVLPPKAIVTFPDQGYALSPLGMQTVRDIVDYTHSEARAHARVGKLRLAFDLNLRSATALLMLYDARGAPVPTHRLEHAKLPEEPERQYARKSRPASVYAFMLRQRLGPDAIMTFRGQGRALATGALVAVAQALGE